MRFSSRTEARSCAAAARPTGENRHDFRKEAVVNRCVLAWSSNCSGVARRPGDVRLTNVGALPFLTLPASGAGISNTIPAQPGTGNV
jgi:hypothetical protein